MLPYRQTSSIEKRMLSDEDFKVLSATALAELVDDFQTEIRRIKLENDIFENFLQASEPSMIADMSKTLLKAFKLQQEAWMEAQRSRVLTPSLASSDETLPRHSEMPINRGPRINLTQKTDIVLREIDDIQVRYERFIRRSKKTQFNIRAELEELQIRTCELEEEAKAFEKMVEEHQKKQKLLRKLPAEIFVRYLQDRHNAFHTILEKLRLHAISSKVQLTKLRKQFAEKEELAEKVDAADLERMEIEKVHLISEIKQKNAHLIELKHITSKARLLLTTHKKYLDKQKAKIMIINESLEDTRQKTEVLMKEAEVAELEVEQERKKLSELKALRENYSVPPIMEYVKKKAELYEEEKRLKVLRRRGHIQDVGLNTYTKMMMQITGSRKPKDSWYTHQYVRQELTEMEDCDDEFSDELSDSFGESTIPPPKRLLLSKSISFQSDEKVESDMLF